jgi:hypothetical protein
MVTVALSEVPRQQISVLIETSPVKIYPRPLVSDSGRCSILIEHQPNPRRLDHRSHDCGVVGDGSSLTTLEILAGAKRDARPCQR